jgi:hypothetical protein
LVAWYYSTRHRKTTTWVLIRSSLTTDPMGAHGEPKMLDKL